MMKILIVGLGSIGRRHLRNLAGLGGCKLAAVTQNQCALPQDGLPPFLPFANLEEGLKWAPDVVFVCNPTRLHLETAMFAARQGCHLFIEKPVSHDQNGLEDLLDLVEKKNLIVQVGFQFRFYPVFQEIKKIVAQGGIGRVISAHAHWGEFLPGWHPWEDYRGGYSAREDLGGGVVLTLCHPFDYLNWILGDAHVVHAVGGHLSRLETDTEDVALVTLHFQRGAIGSVYLDYLSTPPKHTLQIIGDTGRIEWDADLGSAKVYTKGEIVTLSPGKYFDRNELFVAEILDFLDCIRRQREPACTLNDGIRVMDLACATKALLAKQLFGVETIKYTENFNNSIW